MDTIKGLYIHVPFCRQKCLYCDFYSVSYDKETAGLYVDVILRQLNELDPDFSTIYIGGGTPAILDTGTLDKLLSGLKKFLRQGVEFTIETNPESLDEEKLRMFIDKGVSRVSIGVQSFDDKKLKTLGRVHDSSQAIKAIGLSKKSGFENISIDMISGVSGETVDAWKRELEKAAGFDIKHISCYSLSYEKDTPLFRMKEKKEIVPLDEEIAAEMYACTADYLSKKGFERYEVSNFAKQGFECRHNLDYWDNDPYAGIGPSAVSYIRGERSANIGDVYEYIDRYEKGVTLVSYAEKLSDIKMAKETAGLKIRVREGIDYDWFRKKTSFDIEDITEKGVLEELRKDDLIEYKRDMSTGEITGIKLTEKGFLFSDTASSSFL
ncbi:MAG: radical SAM family heme chaperone HemW [Candidatus Omnitrophota bacterium]|jgi:oxygen-independent coproporphyrinogen-3 oxidase